MGFQQKKRRSCEPHKATMLFTTTEMAHRLEEVDKTHLARQVEEYSRLFPKHKFLAQTVGQGIAAVTLQLFGRKLNRLVGFGMAELVSRTDLSTFEGLYSENGAAA